VDKKKYTPSYEARVAACLNRFFDALLIHADPKVLKLDETFSRVGAIDPPVIYTGFVTPAPPVGAGERIRRRLGIGAGKPLIVASLGGGRVGEPLLEAAIKGFMRSPLGQRGFLQVFAGPLMDPERFKQLEGYATDRIRIARFTSEFLSFLAAADLSISMAGYNTCMNVMAAGVPALLWPYSQNREQRLRAERLAAAGGLTVLSEADVSPDGLAAIMERSLSLPPPPKASVDLDGAARTAKWLEEWMTAESKRP